MYILSEQLPCRRNLNANNPAIYIENELDPFIAQKSVN